MILFIVSLTVIYWFSDVYVTIIDFSPHNMFTIIFKLIKFTIEMSLLVTKQAQYWYFQICNEIECWILRNYNYWCTLEETGYNCINFNIIQSIANYIMDQACIIGY